MSFFVNFTNHPSNLWSESQIIEAKKYGDIADVAFPQVEPLNNENEISLLADVCVNKILSYKPMAVLCQGEFTLCFAVVQK